VRTFEEERFTLSTGFCSTFLDRFPDGSRKAFFSLFLLLLFVRR
jgi:hypothetical protein